MQVFQILAKEGEIKEILPYNPFAKGIIEFINELPIDRQADYINKILLESGIGGLLEIETIVADHNIVVYSLTLEKPS